LALDTYIIIIIIVYTVRRSHYIMCNIDDAIYDFRALVADMCFLRGFCTLQYYYVYTTPQYSRLTLLLLLLLRYNNGDDIIFRETYKLVHTYAHAHTRIISESATTRRRTVITQKLTRSGAAYVAHENPRASVAGSRRAARGRVTNGVLRKSRARRHARTLRRRCTRIVRSVVNIHFRLTTITTTTTTTSTISQNRFRK